MREITWDHTSTVTSFGSSSDVSGLPAAAESEEDAVMPPADGGLKRLLVMESEGPEVVELLTDR